MAHVALLLVSHSAEAADGTARIARQMAPDVEIVAAGGIEEGIGTSVDRVLVALERLGAGLVTTGSQHVEPGAGVVVLTDLGSAVLTAEAVLEMVDPQLAALVRIPSAPFVEGAVTAAVEAQQGGDLEAVSGAAVAAGALFAAQAKEQAAPHPATPQPDVAGSVEVPTTVVTARVVLRDPAGLHARPAATLARAASDLAVPVTVDGADARSVLALLQLGIAPGHELTVAAQGEGADQAVQRLVEVIRRLGVPAERTADTGDGEAVGRAPVA